MHKQLRIITSRRLSGCPLSSCLFPVPVVPRLAFNRHLGRLGVHYLPSHGIRVFKLPITWWVWCYPSGRRQLAALPF
jgi:hypothetical protein